MKSFKRVLAMILAASFLLVALTACGPMSEMEAKALGEEYIKVNLDGINSLRKKGDALTNDPDLKALCDAQLAKIDSKTGLIAKKETYFPVGNKTAFMMLRDDSGTPEGYCKAYALTEEYIGQLKSYFAERQKRKEEIGAEEMGPYSEYEKYGVSYCVMNGKVYVAEAIYSDINWIYDE